MAEKSKAKEAKKVVDKEAKDKRNEARRREAVEMGACISVRFKVADAEKLAAIATGEKRSTAHVIREAALKVHGLSK
jgi:hypothetical protein